MGRIVARKPIPKKWTYFQGRLMPKLVRTLFGGRIYFDAGGADLNLKRTGFPFVFLIGLIAKIAPDQYDNRDYSQKNIAIHGVVSG